MKDKVVAFTAVAIGIALAYAIVRRFNIWANGIGEGIGCYLFATFVASVPMIYIISTSKTSVGQ